MVFITRTKKKSARYTYNSEEHEEGDELQEVKPKETGPKANWKELEETQGTCTWQRRYCDCLSVHQPSLEKGSVLNVNKLASQKQTFLLQ